MAAHAPISPFILPILAPFLGRAGVYLFTIREDLHLRSRINECIDRFEVAASVNSTCTYVTLVYRHILKGRLIRGR